MEGNLIFLNNNENVLLFTPDNGDRISLTFRGKQLIVNKQLENMNREELGKLKEYCGNDRIAMRPIRYEL